MKEKYTVCFQRYYNKVYLVKETKKKDKPARVLDYFLTNVTYCNAIALGLKEWGPVIPIGGGKFRWLHDKGKSYIIKMEDCWEGIPDLSVELTIGPPRNQKNKRFYGKKQWVNYRWEIFLPKSREWRVLDDFDSKGKERFLYIVPFYPTELNPIWTEQ